MDREGKEERRWLKKKEGRKEMKSEREKRMWRNGGIPREEER